MDYVFHLDREPFETIWRGQKTIELRMCDEKRKNIAPGDTVRFVYAGDERLSMEVKVTKVHRFKSFEELYKALPLSRCGYPSDDVPGEPWRDMESYPGYSPEEQKRLGVLGIEFEQIPFRKPFRDPFRMDPFLERFASLLRPYWERRRDYRFGQILTGFRASLEQRGIRDLYYLEDEDFLALWEEYLR